jgi:sarcosine oxidase
MYHADAGVLDPDRAMATMLRLAGQRGADIRFGTPVTRIVVGSDSATVHTDSGSLTAPVVVATPGAWIAPLLAGVAELPPLTVTQEQVFYFAPENPPAAGADPWPIFIHQDSRGSFYGLPGGRDGAVPGAIRIGGMERRTVTTAATRDFIVDPATRQGVVAFTARTLPGLRPDPVSETTCLYTNTAHEDFILDRQGPLVIGSACSGHGAKFAPLTGEILADLATGKPTPDARFTLAAHLTR